MFLSTILAATGIICGAQAALQVVNATGSCKSYDEVGKLQMCGNSGEAGCKYDGTPIPPRYMRTDEDVGHDLCAPNEAILQTGPATPKHVFFEQCSNVMTYPGTNIHYMWSSIEWQWKCCACPAGFVPAGSGVGGANFEYNFNNTGGHPIRDTCMRCTGAGETLTYDKYHDKFSCTGGTPTTTTPKPTATPGCDFPSDEASFVRGLEVYHPRFYQVGNTKYIGYGHNCGASPTCGSVRAPLSKPDALALLRKHLAVAQSCVNKLPNARGLNKNQFIALVSFAFNQGCAATEKAFGDLMRQKKYSGVCAALPNTAAGTAALARRRREEARKCSAPTNEGC